MVIEFVMAGDDRWRVMLCLEGVVCMVIRREL